MAYVLISNLMYGDTNKQIKARVSRQWDYHDLNDDTNIFHTDLVLLDEQGNSIHVQIYPPLTTKLKPLLQEGKVYYIDSSVKYANKTYRPVTNPLMISFTKWTTLEECIDVPDGFPAITFSLTPFQGIPSLVDKNVFYVDIMGVITEIGATDTLRPKSRNADTLKRTMQIWDANNSTLPITLWGKTATAFNAEEIYNAGQTKPQVVVFVGTLVKNYRGIGLTLNGSSPCKCFSANFQPIKWVETPATGFNQDVPEEKTIAEILALNPHKHARARFIVNVTIKGIASNSSWWYNSCDICYKTSKPYGYTYKCTSCSNVGIPVPRYKVVLIAGDSTAQATFILFGRIAQRLIRKPVETLIDQNPPDSEYIPDEIAALFNQSFIWNISFTQDTIMKNQETLQVNSIISSNAEAQGLLPISPSSSQQTLATMPAGSSSCLQLAPAASEGSTESKIEAQAKESMLPKDSPSTPIRYTIRSASDLTPTSKANVPPSTKKSYILSISPKPTQNKQISPDPKATPEAKIRGEPPQIASSVEISSSATQDKAKAPTIAIEDTPSASPSLPTKKIPQKRDTPAASAPPAKKLFKDDSRKIRKAGEGNNNMQPVSVPFGYIFRMTSVCTPKLRSNAICLESLRYGH